MQPELQTFAMQNLRKIHSAKIMRGQVSDVREKKNHAKQSAKRINFCNQNRYQNDITNLKKKNQIRKHHVKKKT